MTKNTTLREDKVIKEIEKAFPTYRFGNYLDMGRLIQSKHFDYKNRTRLETKFTKDIIQTLSDVTLLFQYLAPKHQSEIFTSSEFTNFMTRLMDLTKFGKVDDDYLASFYPNMIKFALTGITNSLPVEFTPMIEEHLKPLLRLLNSISAYSKRLGKKGDIAYPTYSEDYTTL